MCSQGVSYLAERLASCLTSSKRATHTGGHAISKSYMDIILQIFKKDSDKSLDSSKSFFVLQDTTFGQSQGNLDQDTLPRSVWFLYKQHFLKLC